MWYELAGLMSLKNFTVMPSEADKKSLFRTPGSGRTPE